MASVKINVPVYIDCFFSDEGVHVYVDQEGTYEERIFSFKKMMEDYIEQYYVPSNPPTMWDVDRAKITEFTNHLLNAVDYLRTLEHATLRREDHIRHRDGQP